ncbi:MAG: hypothetical protein LBM77_08615 [Spirochaetaceae bacterium]|nr:hypothetical protein [Spirochaetaceae bacterium]
MNNNTEKYQNKYRIKSARAPWWNYNGNGTYFITICCKNRTPYFGEIQNGRMQLNKYGQIANDCWTAIPEHFKYAELGLFVIMPDHVHGIISIDMGDSNYGRNNNDPRNINDACVPSPVETLHTRSLQGTVQYNDTQISRRDLLLQIQPKPHSLPTIIRSYKSAVSKTIHEFDKSFTWQSRYYDRIICNDDEYQRISEYIIKNPMKWELLYKDSNDA